MRKIVGFLVLLIIIAGLAYLLYPTVVNELALRDTDSASQSYLRRVSTMSQSQINSTLNQAQRYNDGLPNQPITDVFSVPVSSADPEVPILTATPVPERTAAPRPTVSESGEDEPEETEEDEPDPEVTPEPTRTPEPTAEHTATPEPTETPTLMPQDPNQADDVILHTPIPTAERATRAPDTEAPETEVPATLSPDETPPTAPPEGGETAAPGDGNTANPESAGDSENPENPENAGRTDSAVNTENTGEAENPENAANPENSEKPEGSETGETESPIGHLSQPSLDDFPIGTNNLGPVDTENEDNEVLLHQEATGPEATSRVGRINPRTTAEPEEEATATPEPPKTETLKYQDQLKSGGTVMGVLEIPRLAISLPFYHSTEGQTISTNLIHVEGTDLPIGGNGLSVIAGQGIQPAPEEFLREIKLTGVRLLEDLGSMRGGDIFILRVMNRTMVYRAKRVWSVSMNALSEVSFEEDRDLVILMTNQGNQRLLVLGERLPISEAQKELMEADATLVPPDWLNILVMGLPILLAGILLMLIAELFRRRSYRLPTDGRKKKEKAAKAKPEKNGSKAAKGKAAEGKDAEGKPAEDKPAGK